jgi:hypothetical protein
MKQGNILKFGEENKNSIHVLRKNSIRIIMYIIDYTYFKFTLNAVSQLPGYCLRINICLFLIVQNCIDLFFE